MKTFFTTVDCLGHHPKFYMDDAWIFTGKIKYVHHDPDNTITIYFEIIIDMAIETPWYFFWQRQTTKKTPQWIPSHQFGFEFK